MTEGCPPEIEDFCIVKQAIEKAEASENLERASEIEEEACEDCRQRAKIQADLRQKREELIKKGWPKLTRPRINSKV